MASLAAALERFNRKERNLVIRDILGHAEKPLLLSEDFRKRVNAKLASPEPIPETACWWTDYHISWLAGALAMFMKGEFALKDDPYPNPKSARLIESNQEDIDLVIVTDNHLILIEAKAYGGFEDGQLDSKLSRLNLLHDFYQELAAKLQAKVFFHVLLLSPEPPKHKVPCPRWTCEGKNGSVEIPRIELPLGEGILKVTRCNNPGDGSAEKAFWRIREHKSRVKRGKKI